MENKQKALNEAFYATIFLVTITLIFVYFGVARLTFITTLELIGFLVLGFFTKKASWTAALLLVILFLIDSVFWIMNWFSRTSSPIAAFGSLLVRFALWLIFYKAYLVLKKKQK